MKNLHIAGVHLPSYDELLSEEFLTSNLVAMEEVTGERYRLCWDGQSFAITSLGYHRYKAEDGILKDSFGKDETESNVWGYCVTRPNLFVFDSLEEMRSWVQGADAKNHGTGRFVLNPNEET